MQFLMESINTRKTFSVITIFASLFILVGCIGTFRDTSKKPYESPLPADSVARGEKLYSVNCMECHGKEARGDGQRASQLKEAPPNLRERKTHFTRINLVAMIDTPHYSPLAIQRKIESGGKTMPNFKYTFSKDETQDLINYLYYLMYESDNNQ